MERTEARARLDAAITELKAAGWTQREIENALDGLDRESAVECAEQFVNQLNAA